jgi:hypothetical protein
MEKSFSNIICNNNIYIKQELVSDDDQNEYEYINEDRQEYHGGELIPMDKIGFDWSQVKPHQQSDQEEVKFYL